MPGPEPDDAALAAQRRRLRFRSWHRGTREADLLLGRFADSCVERLSAAQLARFETLLEQPDPDLYDWVAGRQAPPASLDTDVLALLIEHATKPAADR